MERLKAAVKDKVGKSTRKLSRQFRVSHMTISRELTRINLKYRKRVKCPKYTATQLDRIPRCCRALRTQHFIENRVIVLDDEKYFIFANAEIKGNGGFYSDNIEVTPDNVKFK